MKLYKYAATGAQSQIHLVSAIVIANIILSACSINKLCTRPHDMPHPCTQHAAAQLQSIHALACGAQRALLLVAVGAMNIDDVHNRQTSDSIIV